MEVVKDIKRPALKYYGGKWNLAPWIISYFPEHINYVEPCGGAASVLLRKPRSKLETYNDLDGHVVNFFRILRSRPDELIEQIRLTPYARDEYELSRTPSEDHLENARRFFMCAWMSISCMPFEKSTGFRTVSHGEQCYSPHVQNFSRLCNSELLYQVAERFKGVQIENRDALYIIERYDYPTALIYFDPPYLPDTRSQKTQYLVECDEQLHIDAANLLRQAKGCVVISGYAHPLYTELYEDYGWQRVDKEAQTNSGGKRIESLWLSPKTVKALKNV